MLGLFWIRVILRALHGGILFESNDRFSFVGSHWKSVLNIEVKMQASFLFEKSITGTVFHNDSNDKSI